MVKRALFISILFLFSVFSTSFASVKESVNGNALQYTSFNTVALNSTFNAKIMISSIAKPKFNYLMVIELEPSNKAGQNDMFLPGIFVVPKTPIFSYWETLNPYGYKITAFTKLMSSMKEFYKDGYKVNIANSEITNNYKVIYVPAKAFLNYDDSIGDITKKTPLSTMAKWSTHTEFNMFLLNNLKSQTPITLNIIYFLSEVDAFKYQNPQKGILNIDGSILQEWYEVFDKAGFMK
jgi:hypothetical protein